MKLGWTEGLHRGEIDLRHSFRCLARVTRRATDHKHLFFSNPTLKPYMSKLAYGKYVEERCAANVEVNAERRTDDIEGERRTK